jgi:mycothiol synthase
MSSSPPEGFSVRPVTLDDVGAINDLVIAADEAVQGWSDSSEADLTDWWRLVDLEHESWLVENDGPAAYAVAFPRAGRVDIDGYVHPEQKGLGLGSWLVSRTEGRARERGAPSALAWCLAADADARVLFERLGYRETRRFYRMLIEFDGPPPVAELPSGLRIETFRLEDAHAFHSALTEAFAGEWSFVALPFDEWVEHRVKAPDFDPGLWFVVRDGDEIAAVLRGDAERGGGGWVGAIGVREPWRRRGLGLALLTHAFGEFYRRGQRRVALGVDADNPAGATRLYRRAGMHVASEAVAYEKALA